jgi:hypothetical protein
MKKTLSDFKRAIHTGMEIEYVACERRNYNDEECTYEGEYHDATASIPEERRRARYVSYVDTTGFYMKLPDDKSVKGSFCAFPKAGDIEFTGEEFIITDRALYGQPYQKRRYRFVIK